MNGTKCLILSSWTTGSSQNTLPNLMARGRVIVPCIQCKQLERTEKGLGGKHYRVQHVDIKTEAAHGKFSNRSFISKVLDTFFC